MTAERWFHLAGCMARWQLLERELGGLAGEGGRGAASAPALPSPAVSHPPGARPGLHPADRLKLLAVPSASVIRGPQGTEPSRLFTFV